MMADHEMAMLTMKIVFFGGIGLYIFVKFMGPIMRFVGGVMYFLFGVVLGKLFAALFLRTKFGQAVQDKLHDIVYRK